MWQNAVNSYFIWEWPLPSMFNNTDVVFWYVDLLMLYFVFYASVYGQIPTFKYLKITVILYLAANHRALASQAFLF